MKLLACLLTPALVAQVPAGPLKAQYDWGFSSPEGTGKGTLAVLVDPTNGKVVLELHGLGERLMLLQGDAASGYRVQIPRQELDTTAPSLAGLPIPFLPAIANPAGLWALMTEGKGPGVVVQKKDATGPKKMRYMGKDDRGQEVTVWLTRTRWEPASR